MAVQIITSGRTDLDDFFGLSGVLGWTKFPQRPFLAFLAEGDTVTVRVIEKSVEILALSDDTPLMVQWAGEWRSDFMRLTVGDYRAALQAKSI